MGKPGSAHSESCFATATFLFLNNSFGEYNAIITNRNKNIKKKRRPKP